jgi:Ferredoxin subunits of nitrite reductase and ring-hydroxylating dioxygenases
MKDSNDPARPDLASGVSIRALADGGMLLGRVGEDEVLLARAGDSIFAVGAHCTHYRGQLADGLLVGETVRCPLHHACFDLRTGEALRAPALDPIACWRVERDGDTVVVREKKPATESPRASKVPASRPASVGIVGGGAAATPPRRC